MIEPTEPEAANGEMPKAPRKIGNFRVSVDMMRMDWRKILPLFEQMVVVRAECIYADMSFHYTAFSELFEEIEESIAPPDYEILVTRHTKNDDPQGEPWYTFTAERRL